MIISFILLLILLGTQTASAQNTTAFGQTAEFSQFCPTIDGRPAQPGCVAVAMSHVMSRQQFPEKPTGSIAYITATHKMPVMVELDEYTINWNQINNMSTAEDTAAVAQLLFACGAAAKTDYKIENSTASVANQMGALIENFGYDADMRLHSREFYDNTSWLELIQRELSEGRSIIMSAEDPLYGSHSFVIDAFDDDKPGEFHILWGWGGEYDGYYDIDELRVSDYHFVNSRRVLVGIKPDDGKTTEECPAEFSLSFSQNECLANESLKATLNIVNRGYRVASGSYTVYLIGEDGERAQIRQKRYFRDVPTNNAYSDTFTFTAPKQEGEYNIYVELHPFGSYNVLSPSVAGDTQLIVKSSVADKINTINSSQSDNTPVYNLSGQKTTDSLRGIKIRNGRKFLNP